MTSLPPPDQSKHIVHLPANGATVTASALRERLIDAFEQGGATVIDGSAVQTIGQAVLQLMLAGRHQAAAAGTTWDIINASPSLVEMAQSCCLAEAIGLDLGKALAL